MNKLAMTLLWLSLCLPLSANAQNEVSSTRPSEVNPFAHRFGLGAHATGWHGSYGGVGVGGRVRIELTSWLGTDLFGEALLVETPHGLRHDHPIGFNLYVPVRLSDKVRLRPLFGMCVVASFIDPTEPNAQRADDLLFGAHLGAGVDLPLHERLSFFTEAKAVLWFGHDRSLQGWTGAVSNVMQPFIVGQVTAGLTLHFGGA